MKEIYHALGLHFHQPLGNLVALHRQEKERWEARQILWAYDRPTRMVEGWENLARLHFSFSGTLLKQLEDPGVRETFADAVDIGGLLDRYRRGPFEIVGSGLYHPIYPLTPETDWDAQTGWWIGLGKHLFGRDRFQGFWPPEMGFCMEMIPLLARHGYRYVLVDCYYLKPKRPMRWEELRYRPYFARQGGAEIIVIPRDRELSDAQLSGMDPDWFEHEVVQRTKGCDFPALVTTWTDGDNGGWFRTPDLPAGFWGHFFLPTLQKLREGRLAYRPIHIPEYLDRFPPTEEVEVHRGAWNTGHHWGGDFMQWTGSLLQKKGWDEIRNASRYYREVQRAFETAQDAVNDPAGVRQLIVDAYDCILRAETSCNFFWGSAWVHKSFDELERAYHLLDTAKAKLPGKAES
jgi:alpha-amylase/alpha-mannosidase (GH57 family)